MPWAPSKTKLWDAIYDVFGGKVARETIDMFKTAAGTVLFFIDDATVTSMQEQFPRYAENFGPWSEQSNGMLQIAVWSGLRDLGIGANIQHYNPVIDEKVHELFGLPESWRLRKPKWTSAASSPSPTPKKPRTSRSA